MPFFRSLVNWLKRAVVHTAFAELAEELESGGAVATDPPLLTLEVEGQSAEPEKATSRAKGRKSAGKKSTIFPTSGKWSDRLAGSKGSAGLRPISGTGNPRTPTQGTPMPKPENPDVAATIAIVVPIIIIIIILSLLS